MRPQLWAIFLLEPSWDFLRSCLYYIKQLYPLEKQLARNAKKKKNRAGNCIVYYVELATEGKCMLNMIHASLYCDLEVAVI